ncbi:hypothetical protein MY9_2449 [Bacillus sp. JS]|nr:hypothetical protein MY9_2449 [Bacillus sp. JS]
MKNEKESAFVFFYVRDDCPARHSGRHVSLQKFMLKVS